jgi:hypothetical protein
VANQLVADLIDGDHITTERPPEVPPAMTLGDYLTCGMALYTNAHPETTTREVAGALLVEFAKITEWHARHHERPKAYLKAVEGCVADVFRIIREEVGRPASPHQRSRRKRPPAAGERSRE